MKVAVAGKGGSGKTTVAGTLARLMARAGHQVLAIDADPNPNLAVNLGIDPQAVASMKSDPLSLVHHAETAEGKYSVGMDVAPEEIVAEYGVPAPDGVTLLLVGRVEAHQAGAG